MDKELYLRKLSRAARWKLPWEEAEEVIADYRELLADSGEEDFGDPVQAVRLLERPKEYRRWLGVFVFLTLAALLGPVSGLNGLPFEFGIWVNLPVLYGLWDFFSHNGGLLMIFPLAGMALGLLWFRRRERKPSGKLAVRRLAPALGIQLFFMAAAWGVFWLTTEAGLGAGGLWAFLNDHPWSFRFLRLLLILGGPVCGALGLWGLIRARLEDRRWLAVYVWGAAAAGICTAVLMLLSSISLDVTLPGWWIPYVWSYLGLTAAGLLGTGWALC